MRILLKILKWLTLGFVTLVIVMFAINWNDQEPSPATVEMESLLKKGSEIPDEENAFVYAMGFDAPKGSDPAQAGAECVAKFNAAVHKRKINFDSGIKCWSDSLPAYKNDAITKLLSICATANKACEDALQQNERAIAQWLQDDNWLLQRYEGLLQRSKWHTTTEYSLYMRFPPYGVIGDGRKMNMLKAWYLAGQGESMMVQQLLNRDVIFWRMTLASSETALDKMIATAFLGKDFVFGNMALRRLRAKGINPNIPDAWLAPFSEEELSLQRTMAGEWAFSSSILQEIKKQQAPLVGDSVPEEQGLFARWVDDVLDYFLLPQATQNDHAEVMLRLVEMLDVPIKQLPQALQQVETYSNDIAVEDNLWHLYNPVGHFLNFGAVSAYSDYFTRVYDLEGARQALLATTQLRADGIEVDKIEAALSKSELRNPYNDTPFVWDVETGSIVFKGLGPEDRNTHSFLY